MTLTQTQTTKPLQNVHYMSMYSYNVCTFTFIIMYVYVFMYVGNEYYIGFIPNAGAPPLLIMLNNRDRLATYTIEVPVLQFSRSGAIIANIQNIVSLPDVLTGLSPRNRNALDNEYKEGVYLQTSRSQIATIGLSNSTENSDTFFAIPTVDLCLYEYTYFAMSEYHNRDGSVVIVGTADQTIMNITVPHLEWQWDLKIKINNSADWAYLSSKTLYTFEIQRLQIVYIAATHVTELIGTKVTTDKPISLFSGHECSYVPSFAQFCNNLAEQIPPTELWGTEYYFAPLVSRTSYAIKIIAAYDSTTVEISCDNHDRLVRLRIDAGESTTETFSYEYCGLFATKKVLIAQFSRDYEADSSGGQMMMLVPPTTHYTNRITSSTFQPSTQVNSYNHYINIIAIASYDQRQMISITTAGGENRSSESLYWKTLFGGNDTEIYAAQVGIPHGVFEVTHFNKSVLMTVMVYGFEVRAVTNSESTGAYGHPGWLMAKLNAGM